MSEQNLIAFACLITFITVTSVYVRLRSGLRLRSNGNPEHLHDLGAGAGKKLLDSMTEPPLLDEQNSEKVGSRLDCIPAAHK